MRELTKSEKERNSRLELALAEQENSPVAKAIFEWIGIAIEDSRQASEVEGQDTIRRAEFCGGARALRELLEDLKKATAQKPAN